MPYQVLARKWRPQTFATVIGQGHVTRTLQNGLAQGRIAHAYLFSGPRGVGKTTTARLLAKALNCENRTGVEPCTTCPACLEIQAGRAMDVIEIDGASNRGIDEIRALRENVRYAPARGRSKVYIIDEVHMLTEQAFNALLKTLEEPPKHVVFVFATTEPFKVPATILSRCQRYDFRRIAPKETVERLVQVARAEGIEVEAECLELLAQKADGSMRDAVSLLDQLHSAAEGALTVDGARELLGMLPEETYRELSEHVFRRESKEALALAAKALDEGADLEELIAGYTEHLKTLLLARLESPASGVSPSPSAQDLLRMIGVLVELGRDVKRSTQPRTLLEVALVRLSRMDDSVSLAQVLEGLGRLGISVRPRAAEPPPKKGQEAPPVSSPSKPQGSLDLAAIETRWGQVVDSLQQEAMAAGSFLASGRPVGYRDGVLQIAFPLTNAFSKEQVESKHRAAVEKTLSQFFNIPLRIGCSLTPAPPGKEVGEPAADRKAALASGEDSGGVRRVLEAFGGEIV